MPPSGVMARDLRNSGSTLAGLGLFLTCCMMWCASNELISGQMQPFHTSVGRKGLIWAEIPILGMAAKQFFEDTVPTVPSDFNSEHCYAAIVLRCCGEARGAWRGLAIPMIVSGLLKNDSIPGHLRQANPFFKSSCHIRRGNCGE
jgi:hypothetical protein